MDGGVGSVIGGVIGAGGSLLGGKKAAKSADQATAAQLQMFDKVQQNLAPYMNFGTGTLPVLNAMLGISSPAAATTAAGTPGATTTTSPTSTGTMFSGAAPTFTGAVPQTRWDNMMLRGKDIRPILEEVSKIRPLSPDEQRMYNALVIPSANQATTTTTPAATSQGFDSSSIQAALENLPGYQFTKTQGLKSVQNAAAARGLGISGAALKGAADFATGLADNTFGNQFNRLLESAKLGANAAAGVGSAATGMSGGIANSIMTGGQAQAAGTMGAGNAIANSIYAGNIYGNRNSPWLNPDTGVWQ